MCTAITNLEENMADFREELRNAFVLARNNLPAFRSAITNKDVVVFLGNTRSGKSTLINYIIATRLVVLKIRRNLYKIEKLDENDQGPHIGQGSLSDTTIPGVYEMTGFTNTVAIDAPGFSDNRGEVQDIINAVFVNQIKFARTCKFVLVSDVNDITSDNIGGFLSLIVKVKRLLPNFEELHRSVSLMVTKDNNEYAQDEIANLLREKVLDVCGLNISQENRELIDCFVQQDELIGLFRMPDEEGEVVRNLGVNIEGAICSTHQIPINRISIEFAISDESQLTLLEIFREFSDDLLFEEELNKLIEPYRAYFDVEQYIYASTDDELLFTKKALNGLKNKLSNNQNRFLVNVGAVLDSIMTLIPIDSSGDLYKTLTLFAMLHEVGIIQQSFIAILVRKYKRALFDFMNMIKTCVDEIEKEEKIRKDLDLNLKSNMVTTGASVGAAAVGGALLRSLTMRTLVTRAVGVATGIGTIVTVIGAAASIGSYLVKKEQTEKRAEARIRQGRPPFEFS